MYHYRLKGMLICNESDNQNLTFGKTIYELQTFIVSLIALKPQDNRCQDRMDTSMRAITKFQKIDKFGGYSFCNQRLNHIILLSCKRSIVP